MHNPIVRDLRAEIEKGRQWNQLLEVQLKNLQSLYSELNEAVVGYLEMRVSYEELLPHLTLKGESAAPNASNGREQKLRKALESYVALHGMSVLAKEALEITDSDPLCEYCKQPLSSVDDDQGRTICGPCSRDIAEAHDEECLPMEGAE